MADNEQSPIKVCTGCGHRSDRGFDSETALACCPDSNYVDLDEYLKNSVYKPVAIGPLPTEKWEDILKFHDWATKEHVIGFVSQNFECVRKRQ